MASEKAYRVIGFVYMTNRRHFTDPASYSDWIGLEWTKKEMREALRMGQIPEGTLVMSAAGPLAVLGVQGQRGQLLATLPEALDYKQLGKKPDREEVRDEWDTMAARRRRITSLLIVRDLRILRTRLGWTQNELAEYVGVSMMTISKIERGHTRLQPSTQQKFMKLREHYARRMG